MLKQEAQNLALRQEQYYQSNRLYYGLNPKENGDASWWLALNNHPISSSEYRMLRDTLPQAIADFHHVSIGLLRRAFFSANLSPALADLQKQIIAGVPDETVEIYQEALKRNLTSVFSTRPDIMRPANSEVWPFPIIEYNVDGSADKGNTAGVNAAQSLVTHDLLVGKGLARLFVNGVRQRFPDKAHITVATITPEDYRQAYDSQNGYFARQANQLGKNKIVRIYSTSEYDFDQSEVRWIHAQTSDIDIKANGLFTTVSGEKIHIDVVDKEFKLPGFNNVSLQKEADIVKAALDGTVDLLGTPLPLGDKVLLSTPFNPALRKFILEDLGNQAEKRLQNIQRVHATTHVVSDNSVTFNGVTYSLEDLSETDYAPGFVLKRGGDSELSGESKGVYFSHGRGSQEWTQALANAQQEAFSNTAYWVLQKVIQPKRFLVSTIPNSRSEPKELSVPVRFAPYFVSAGGKLELGNVLVTAGTDREVEKLGSLNIHGQKKNTYQGAVLT